MGLNMSYWKWWYTQHQGEIEGLILLYDITAFVGLVMLSGFVIWGRNGIGYSMIFMVAVVVLGMIIWGAIEVCKNLYAEYLNSKNPKH